MIKFYVAYIGILTEIQIVSQDCFRILVVIIPTVILFLIVNLRFYYCFRIISICIKSVTEFASFRYEGIISS